MSSVEQYKEDIADKYIKDFKKDLNFFEKMMIAPISKKMKEILKSDKRINVNSLKDLEDLWFWRNVLGVQIWNKKLFEKLVDKTFDFLKEKQEKIIQAQTEWRLDELSNLVINWKLDNLEQRVNNGEWTPTETGSTELADNWGNTGESTNWWNTWEWNSGDWTNDEWKNEQWPNSIAVWAVAGVWWATAYYETISIAEKKMWINKLKEAPKEFDAKWTKRILEDLSEQMQSKLDSGLKMNKSQRKVYQKSIKQFNDAAESIWGKETQEAFRAWQSLQDRLPSNLLTKGVKADRWVLNAIDALPDEELVKIIWKDEKTIIKIFDSKWIKVSEDLARQLKVTKNVAEIKWLTKILRNWTKLSNFLKWIKWMWAITVLFAWFDVWCYIESEKEAELVSKINEVRWDILKDTAKVQLMIWIWSVVAEALTIAVTCALWWSVVWPWWTIIWVAVWILAAIASIWYDELVGNRKEFYAQNRYDFVNQKRTKVKQSIVQLFESDRLNMDEWFKESIKDDRWQNSEIDTMEDAWEALIYQEEIAKWWYYALQVYYNSWENREKYLNKLKNEEKEQFLDEEKQMEDIIKLRMEYIKQYIKDDKNSKEYKEMKDALARNQWMEYVEQLLADSKVYAYLKTDNEDAYIQNYKELNVQTYKEAYKQKLSQEYSQEFAMFEKMREGNPRHLHEICEWTLMCRMGLENEFENDDWEPCYTEDQIITMKKNIDFVSKYNEYYNLGRPVEMSLEKVEFNDMDYNYIEQVLLDLNSINKRPVWSKDGSMKYLSSEASIPKLESVDSQVSDSLFQNIVYSIAREIHGYTWNNEKLELIRFYSWDGNDTWIYYDKAWEANIDWNIDRAFTESDVDTKEKMKAQILWNEIWTWSPYFWVGAAVNPAIFTSGLFLNHKTAWAELDSPVEAADNQLNAEFRKKVEAIIDREFLYREKKKDYEKQIVDFITLNNQWQDGYVEIPEYMVLNAKRAWIWDVHKFLYRVENGQIYALSRGDMVSTVLHFDDPNIKIKYEALNPLRTELTEQEKQLITYVDAAEKKLNTLRTKQWQFLFWKEHEDDLDIPVELERVMSQKSIEWNNLKESILYMQPNTAHDYLSEKSKEYYDFFSGMYLWLLNTVTNMNHFLWINSDDVDDSAHFLTAIQFVWLDIVSVKDWKLEINDSTNASIKEYLPTLFDSYKHWTTWKTVKELLMSEDDNDKELWQELAKRIYELCLEETALEFDNQWNVDSISTLDFSDNDLEKVKKKLASGLEWIWFYKAHSDYKSANIQYTELEFTTRAVEKVEVDSHNGIDIMTKNIVNTMKNVDRAWKRKEPKFKADAEQKEEWKISWVLSSRWYSEKITVNMDESKNIESVKIDWLWTFKNPQEGFRIANFINWIKNNVSEHPYWESVNTWSLKYYEWDDNVLQRHHTWIWWDYDILTEETLNKYYPSIKNSPKFLKYINGFM